MQILWVGKASHNASAGDEVFDRKVIACIRACGHTVHQFFPRRLSRPRSLFNMCLHGIPHYRSWYECADNYADLHTACRASDVALFSWEPFDKLAYSCAIPSIPILHNITSSSIPAFLHNSFPARLLAWQARRWENMCYSSGRFPAIACLSLSDIADLESRFPQTRFLHCPPGAPPQAALATGAAFRPELMITGTYGWTPKKRDVLKFAEEYAESAGRLEVFADALPEQAARLLFARPVRDAPEHAIRLGLITDRFRSGHKLKTTEYIANNCVVLTFAELERDFLEIPDRDFFIRKLKHASDIASHAAEVSRVDPTELRSRFAAFKQRCSERFDWQVTSDRLLAALEDAIK